MEEDQRDGISKVFWEVELKNLNSSLPQMRPQLTELLNMTHPSYVNIGGETVSMDKNELIEFSRLIPKEKMESIRLPIVIMKESGMKKGVYSIEGNEAEVEAVNLILDRRSISKYVYKPEILEMSKKFPSLIAFGFLL